MANGETGRNGWLHRRNETAVKVALTVVVPVTGWLLLTVVTHSEELAERGSRQDRTVEDQAIATEERNAISRKVERIDERTEAIQRSLDRQDQKLDTLIERVGR